MRCKKCLLVAYCSRAHQEEDWAEHKGVCKQHANKKQGKQFIFPETEYLHINEQLHNDKDGVLFELSKKRIELFKNLVKMQICDKKNKLFEEVKQMAIEERKGWLELQDYQSAARIAWFLAISSLQMGKLRKFVKWEKIAKEDLAKAPENTNSKPIRQIMLNNRRIFDTFLEQSKRSGAYKNNLLLSFAGGLEDAQSLRQIADTLDLPHTPDQSDVSILDTIVRFLNTFDLTNSSQQTDLAGQLSVQQHARGLCIWPGCAQV